LRDRLFSFVFIALLAALIGSIAVFIVADISYIKGPDLLEIMRSPEISFSVVLTLITSIVTTAFCILFAVPSAYALSRFKIKGAAALDMIIDLLMVLPVLVVGVSILVFFRVGSLWAVSPVLPVALMGKGITFLGDVFIYKQAGIVLAQFFCSVPFAVRVIKSSFDDLSPRLEQVAQTLGCDRWRAFWDVSLPLARHGILAGAVLAWARAFGLFGPISIIAGAVRKKTEVLSTSIFLEISIGRLESGIAISLFMVAIAVIVLLLMRFVSGKALMGKGGNA